MSLKHNSKHSTLNLNEISLKTFLEVSHETHLDSL